MRRLKRRFNAVKMTCEGGPEGSPFFVSFALILAKSKTAKNGRFSSLGLRLGLCLGLLFQKFRVTLLGFLTYKRSMGKNTTFQE